MGVLAHTNICLKYKPALDIGYYLAQSCDIIFDLESK